MTQPIIIQGQENTGKTDAQTSVAELASRVRNLEEEVDGVEPPKSEEMKKIEELEEKIDKLLMIDSMEAESFQETRLSEEVEGKPGHEVVDKVNEDNLIEPEEIDAEEPEEKVELFSDTYNYENLSGDEIEQAIKEVVINAEEPITYYDISERAFGKDIDAKHRIYKKISQVVNDENNKLYKADRDGRQHKISYSMKDYEPKQEEFSRSKSKCKHCGKLFDNRGIVKHEPNCAEKQEEAEELSELQEKLLKKLSQTSWKGSKMLAAGMRDIERKEVQKKLTGLKDKNLVDAKRGYGYKLTDKGREIAEELDVEVEGDKADPDSLSLTERVKKARSIFEDSDELFTRTSLARRLYNIPEDEEIETYGDYYKRADAAFKRLKTNAEIEKVKREDSKTYYKFKTEEESSDENETEGESVSDVFDWEEVKQQAGVNDQDVAIVQLAFDKLVNRKNLDEITYHDFEQHYSGEEKSLRMFQKLFQNPNLIEGIRERVIPNKTLTWKKKGEGKFGTGVKNWVILVE